jgi:hypothetical protein
MSAFTSKPNNGEAGPDFPHQTGSASKTCKLKIR